ncbi:lipopolysaccharide transport system ATP-binding protein [Methylomagnum ishizawai]|uniref:Lipopolysaccharide transport system ATP-binding protein n=1 Tax=Methylomagnum ishizawai TaxID=1760988 RepID=A0A1Y6D4R1_9GAMM|nr:ABC transporter ATP-binding protein [Methylomagnum ishizawai]SMF94945.1 lipopolysaccharide transport system ATP-binding protein [Methylomagnum ishizawai]
MSAVLEVSHLGKAYRDFGGEWRRVLSWFGLPLRPREEHWTLRDVSFALQPGEAVGIAGQNGAGKSTLLKIIAGTLRPSEGGVAVRGRVAAILELGMGFHPELTGRQNAYHAAGLMGHSPGQIDAEIDAIEAFAEIGEYFDQPVRTYSSGMQMRVAFAVATAHRPDILIIDEALSVGDAYFQHKSFARIREFQRQGSSLLIVSHDRGAIQAICDRAILLDQGRVIQDGNPETVMDFYNALIAQKENSKVEQSFLDDGRARTVSGTGEASILDVALLDGSDAPVEFVNVGQKLKLKITAQANADLPELVVGYMIKDRLGQPVFGTNTHHLDRPLAAVPQGARVESIFHFAANLGEGAYSIAVALHASPVHITRNYEWRDLALVFKVINIDQTPFVGVAWLPPALENSVER